jgi:hypothetical protein
MKKSTKQVDLQITICLLILLFGIILVAGCDIPNPFMTTAERAAQTIDNALVTADFNSDQWRAEVDKLATQLDQIEPKIAQDVRDILAKTIATAGTEIRCNIDFVHERTRQDLQRLSDSLRGRPTTPPQPSFCQVVPTGVDMNNRPNFVEFYGYDFKLRQRDSNSPGGYNETNRVKAFLKFDGGETPLDSWTDIPTHYLLTVKTSQSDTIPICNKDNRHIVLRANDGTELSSIGVVKFTCPKAAPPPAPKPERTFYTIIEPFGADPWGHTDNRQYGGACSAGYHRSRYLVTEEGISGNAGCYFNKWVDSDEHSCKIDVRFWEDLWGGLNCNIKIFEAGDVQPPNPDPPCPCW